MNNCRCDHDDHDDVDDDADDDDGDDYDDDDEFPRQSLNAMRRRMGRRRSTWGRSSTGSTMTSSPALSLLLSLSARWTEQKLNITKF